MTNTELIICTVAAFAVAFLVELIRFGFWVKEQRRLMKMRAQADAKR